MKFLLKQLKYVLLLVIFLFILTYATLLPRPYNLDIDTPNNAKAKTLEGPFKLITFNVGLLDLRVVGKTMFKPTEYIEQRARVIPQQLLSHDATRQLQYCHDTLDSMPVKMSTRMAIRMPIHMSILQHLGLDLEVPGAEVRPLPFDLTMITHVRADLIISHHRQVKWERPDLGIRDLHAAQRRAQRRRAGAQARRRADAERRRSGAAERRRSGAAQERSARERSAERSARHGAARRSAARHNTHARTCWGKSLRISDRTRLPALMACRLSTSAKQPVGSAHMLGPAAAAVHLRHQARPHRPTAAAGCASAAAARLALEHGYKRFVLGAAILGRLGSWFRIFVPLGFWFLVPGPQTWLIRLGSVAQNHLGLSTCFDLFRRCFPLKVRPTTVTLLCAGRCAGDTANLAGIGG